MEPAKGKYTLDTTLTNCPNEHKEVNNSAGAGGKYVKKPATFIRIPHRKPVVTVTQPQQDSRVCKPAEVQMAEIRSQEEHLHRKQKDINSKEDSVLAHTPLAQGTCPFSSPWHKHHTSADQLPKDRSHADPKYHGETSNVKDQTKESVIQQNQNFIAKRILEKDNCKRTYQKILRKVAIAAAKASKYGWPSPPKDVRCKEEAEAAKRAQEKVIRIFGKACADAALVCRDYISNTYPRECAEIMAKQLQQFDDDDSSKDSTAVEDAENEESNNQPINTKEQGTSPI